MISNNDIYMYSIVYMYICHLYTPLSITGFDYPIMYNSRQRLCLSVRYVCVDIARCYFLILIDNHDVGK